MSNGKPLDESRIAAAIAKAAARDEDLQSHNAICLSADPSKHLEDALFYQGNDFAMAQRAFEKLRWGGQLIYVSNSPKEVKEFGDQLKTQGFDITQPPAYVGSGILGKILPFLSRKTYYTVARKIELIPPGKSSDRFTYYVHLDGGGDGEPCVVMKEVPSKQMVMDRLQDKWPDLKEEEVEKRARKFSDKIFPMFLTREAAILKIVHRDVPEEYRQRLPRLLDMETDERGYAKILRLSWLRNGGNPLTQLEFARQSADLLRVLHDEVGVMHLDLRLDNFVITPDGVGFVDFGSAVRVSEDLKENPLLSNLFEELMRTSQIQRMLFSMTKTGQVTSQAISQGLHKVDKAVDYFYLAVQISSPHNNPDLRDLILYDKNSDEAKRLAQLTEQILRPKDPSKPAFRSAADILKGIERIAKQLNTVSSPLNALLQQPSAKNHN